MGLKWGNKMVLRASAVIAAAVAILLSPALPALAVTEVDAPSCRWSISSISYRWGGNLQGPSAWRTAFQTSLSDWNNIPSSMNYYHAPGSGKVFINTYWAQDGRAGYAHAYCSGATTALYDVYGNTYYDAQHQYSANHRRSVTGHELGHGWSLGHISDPGVALLGNNPNPDTWFKPQPLDINLVFQVY